MMPCPTLITVYGNTAQTARLAEIQLFLRHLGSCGAKVEIWSEFEAYLSERGFGSGLPAVDMPSADSRLVITLGGDGTLLHALSWCRGVRIPLLGVNTGHLGFLTAYSLGETHLLLAEMKAGHLVAERRMLLELRCASMPLPPDIWPFALNEVAILKADSSSMINVSTRVDNFYLTDYRADGMIVSTPTGSTGYSLSAGGPIMAPTLGCLVLTPIAAHTLSIRPLVVDAASRIGLEVESRDGNYRVSLDGRSFTMPSGSKLEVHASDAYMELVRRADVDFAATLRSKLHWGAD